MWIFLMTQKCGCQKLVILRFYIKNLLLQQKWEIVQKLHFDYKKFRFRKSWYDVSFWKFYVKKLCFYKSQYFMTKHFVLS